MPVMKQREMDNTLEIIKQRLQAKKDEFTEELSYSEKAVLRAIILEYEQLIEEIEGNG